MTRRRLKVPDLPPEAVRSLRDLDEVDAVFKRVFSGSPPATRREFAPVGFVNRLRWLAGKVMMKGEAL